MAVWESSTKMVNDFNLSEKSEHFSLPIYPLTLWSKTIRLETQSILVCCTATELLMGLFEAEEFIWYGTMREKMLEASKRCHLSRVDFDGKYYA